MSGNEAPTIAFASQAAWEGWLAEEHARSDGIWLKFARKGSGIDSVTYPEAVESALCYGWIDGQVKRLDAEHYVQRFTPRRSRSRWSRINTEKATALIDQGRMQPAGLREVERARADGRWDAAYEPPRTATVPADLQQALDANDAASAFFATLDGTNRYAILHRVAAAKRPETRAKRIETFVAMLAEGRKIHT
jgi:uncharacterized protein YdeI (YjbR/CyaY-like superfamily)